MSIIKKGGFTLIETVMVLAIAGLILVVVFLAVGGAQRANRDTQRVNEAGQIAAAMEAYARDHDGAYPLAVGGTIVGTTYFANIKDVSTGDVPKYSVDNVLRADQPEHFAAGYKCGSTGIILGSSHTYAISYWSEQGGAAVCKDNQ